MSAMMPPVPPARCEHCWHSHNLTSYCCRCQDTNIAVFGYMEPKRPDIIHPPKAP